jgi:hypothetical protein
MFRAGNVISKQMLKINHSNSLNGKISFARIATPTFILNSLSRMAKMIVNVAIQTTVGNPRNSTTIPPVLNWMGNTKDWLVLNATNQPIIY